MTLTKIHQHTFTLTAAQCNARQEIAPAHLVQHIIECATEHADILGVGFERLQEDGMLWVLSRVAIEMNRYPRLLEKFTISTWIENFNRHFSQRNFDIVSHDGEVLGYARTIWVAIDKNTRRPADLSGIASLAATVAERSCPIDPPRRIRMAADTEHTAYPYTFRVSDIDFNRHVTSSRYIEVMLDALSFNFFDTHMLQRLEVDYQREAHCGDQVQVVSSGANTPNMTCEIRTADGQTVCISQSKFI